MGNYICNIFENELRISMKFFSENSGARTDLQKARNYEKLVHKVLK
jgi:hypothetical protein